MMHEQRNLESLWIVERRISDEYEWARIGFSWNTVRGASEEALKQAANRPEWKFRVVRLDRYIVWQQNAS